MSAPGNKAERRISLPADVQWQRVHPITPVLEGWKIITAILVFATFRNSDALLDLIEAVREGGLTLAHDLILWGVGGVLALLLFIGAYLVLAWRAKTFAIDRDGVYLRTGILAKQLRTARLPRIQAVDVVHPLIGRMLGLGQLTVEVAGGTDSRVVIGYLRTGELLVLRDQILDLAAGARTTTDMGVAPQGAAPEAEGGPMQENAVPGDPAHGSPVHGTPAGSAAVDGARVTRSGSGSLLDLDASAPLPTGRLSGEEDVGALYTVETSTLIGSILRSWALILSVVSAVGVAGILMAIPLVFHEPIFEQSKGFMQSLSALLAMFAAPFALLSYVWSRFSNGWGFRAAATPAGIRLRFGLTSDTSTTLPPGRVHAVGLGQELLWRGKDWWRVSATVAGRETVDNSSSGSVETTGTNILLPAGDRDTALRALWLVTPDLGVSDPDALLEAALTGQDDDGVGDPDAPVGSAERGFVRVPRRARIFDWISWRRQAVALTDTCVILRLGRWHRRVSVIPYERIQSVHVAQGPLARRRNLAALRLDLVQMGTAVSAVSNLDAADAGQLAQVIAQRALRRRRAEDLDRWLARALAAREPQE